MHSRLRMVLPWVASLAGTALAWTPGGGGAPGDLAARLRTELTHLEGTRLLGRGVVERSPGARLGNLLELGRTDPARWDEVWPRLPLVATVYAWRRAGGEVEDLSEGEAAGLAAADGVLREAGLPPAFAPFLEARRWIREGPNQRWVDRIRLARAWVEEELGTREDELRAEGLGRFVPVAMPGLRFASVLEKKRPSTRVLEYLPNAAGRRVFSTWLQVTQTRTLAFYALAAAAMRRVPAAERPGIMAHVELPHLPRSALFGFAAGVPLEVVLGPVPGEFYSLWLAVVVGARWADARRKLERPVDWSPQLARFGLARPLLPKNGDPRLLRRFGELEHQAKVGLGLAPPDPEATFDF